MTASDWLLAKDAPSDNERNKLRRQRLFAALGAIVFVATLAALLWWGLIGRNYVSTDNAYVGAATAQVTPLTSGRVQAVLVDNSQYVNKGDVLVVIDPEDAKLAFKRADAAYSLTVRKVETYFATAAAQRAAFRKAELDYKRRAPLAGDGAVSPEELTAARAAYDVARSSLAAADALTRGTDVMHHPEVLAARAQLETAKLNLERTVIRAPVSGIVVQRAVQVGQMAAAGYPVMAVVPVDDVYVDANFKESQLARVHPGQKATLTSDLYGSSVTYHGRVVGLGGGTGSAFAVIPAQNATGNWIKVVQRVPVRISLDREDLRQHPLRVGLSMTASIKVTE
ncbi:MAG: efflux RND transporter periplasmic adaptor subunit [Alphaproteobacteria bacterium]|nr:efflux RND transporter periplasmic adaptor subunit [Alphaproteobacteria bacterium]